MKRPVIIDHTEGNITDDTGTEWVQALLDTRGRVVAGRHAATGDFHCYTDCEELFDTALGCITQALEIATERTASVIAELGDADQGDTA